MYVYAAYCYRWSSVVCMTFCRSVCHDREPCRNGWADWDAVWDVHSGGPSEPCITWGNRSSHAWTGNFEGVKGPAQDMSGGRYIQSNSAGGRTGTARMPNEGTRWSARWRNLANTTELSVRGGDAALCQITSTTCWLTISTNMSLYHTYIHTYAYLSKRNWLNISTKTVMTNVRS